MVIATLNGITAQSITTARISSRVLTCGPADGTPVVFVHGNLSSATYWEETMLALPDGFRGIAYDQRGYGDADPNAKIDATRGMGELADDLKALLDALNIDTAHFVGHSMGGSVLWRFMMDYPDAVLSVTQAAPGSPYGYGGTKDTDGTPTWPDFAGSGGGIVNQQFAQMIADNVTTEEQGTPRFVMNNFYWKPPFKPQREEALLASMLSAHIGDKDYPGDLTPSNNWPNVAPGQWGVANALSPKYAKSADHLLQLAHKPPVLWIHGADDMIVSDTSMFEMGGLGAVGALPNYPGAEVFPPQPMVSQIRALLEKYKAAGGTYEEIIFEDCAHTPYLEKFAEFNAALHRWLQA
jgi:pimeloyl-ACP methyl ester carboxylesterase